MSWKTLFLGELVGEGHIHIQTGPFGTQLKAADYTEAGTPVINVRNIGYGSLRPDKLEHVPEAVCDRLKKHLLSKDDIVFGRKGAVDRHLLVQESQSGWMQGSDCIRIRFLSKAVLPKFLSYALLVERHKAWILTQCSNKATMASLNQDVICRIPLNLPGFNTQQEIVYILSAYDNLIENNRRRIQLLEQSARLLYKEWFAQLRFPGHEHVAIVDGVPEGWERDEIGRFFDTTSGGTPSRKNPSFYTGDINWVKTQELNENYIFETEERITKEALNKSSTKLFPQGTLLVSIYGGTNIGRTAILAAPSATNQACVALLPNHPSANSIFAQLFFQSIRDKLISIAQGSAQTNISQQTLRKVHILIPPHRLMQVFLSHVEPLFHQKKNLELQQDKLIGARDILIPRLMNGEIPV